MRLVSYLRVSTDRQGESGLGLESQRATVARYAALYGHEIVAEHVDVGSGTALRKRPALEAAACMVERGAADGVAVARLDRLARNVRHLLGLLDRVAVISVAEQFDTASPTGRMVVTVLGALAEWEAGIIKERTRGGLAALRARGMANGGAAPFGWQRCGARLVAVPGEQATLDRARHLRSSGLTWGGAAARLNSAGLLTRGGREWNAGLLWRTLQRATKWGHHSDPVAPATVTCARI